MSHNKKLTSRDAEIPSLWTVWYDNQIRSSADTRPLRVIAIGSQTDFLSESALNKLSLAMAEVIGESQPLRGCSRS